jgi:hypothetical protein
MDFTRKQTKGEEDGEGGLLIKAPRAPSTAARSIKCQWRRILFFNENGESAECETIYCVFLFSDTLEKQYQK